MNYSFEFFPGKDRSSINNLIHVAKGYVDTVENLKYFSVTYGAGGTTRDTTVETVKTLISEFDVPVYAHLTTVGHSWEDIDGLLRMYTEMGVKGIVALRGDIPSGMSRSDTKDSHSLIRHISDNYKHFDIKAAGYPEKHPDSKSLSDCIDGSVAKLACGASSIITQFCLNSEAIINFGDEVQRRSGADDSVVTPGLIPIYNFEQFKKFAHKCEAEVPRWIEEHFKYNEVFGDPTGFARELFLSQLRTVQREYDHVHIYTLNRNIFGIDLDVWER